MPDNMSLAPNVLPKANFMLNVQASNMPLEWKNFAMSLKIYIAANNLDAAPDKRKVAILLNLIGTEALQIYYAFDVDMERITFKDLLKKFESYFMPRVNTSIERHKLFNRKQGQQEDLESYGTDLKNISLQCDIADDLLKDIFSWNLNSTYIKERILVEKPKTFEEAFNLAKLVRSTKLDTQSLATSQSQEHINSIRSSHSSKQVYRTSRSPALVTDTRRVRSSSRPRSGPRNTFNEVEEYSLRVTAVLKAQGVKKGDIVGLLVNNSPQLPALWLGIARLGAITPLVNTNQRGKALIHSINVAKCDVFIFSDEYQSDIQDVLKDLSPSLKLFKFSHRPLNKPDQKASTSDDSFTDFTSLLETTPPAPWTLADGDGFQGKLLYIYTSGTTGLPKAAVISNARFVFMATGIHFMGLNKSDTVYCPLPLYHTAGGVISVGQALIMGCTVALKAKFSASQYFPDCIKYKATAAHYIGEMCRYVLATPPSPSDTQHSVRIIYGNGLRPQIWKEFVSRFNIQNVTEFYGATEGNANIANTDGTPGAIGFVSRIFPKVYPIAIIKVDQETGEPIRDSNGLCQVAEPDEPGVFIGKIQTNNPARQYLGYVDKAASEKKVVRDVFQIGDAAFISGDVLVADELGYLFFRDRTGDTFRWRGENVSTTEVEAAVSRFADHRDAVVYGVLVPNTEGRAGMCGIVDVNGTLDLDKLAKDMARDLPVYARPVFLRIMPSMDMTGTFKMKKTDLQKEGFDPKLVKNDKLYYLDLKQSKYLPLGVEEYDKIISGQIRL